MPLSLTHSLVSTPQQDCHIMRRLNSVLGQEMMYQPYMAQGSDTATGQNMGLLTRIDPVQALRTTNSREAYPVQVRSSMLFMCIHPPIVTCMVGELQGSTCGSHETGDSGCSKHFGALFRIEGACVRACVRACVALAGSIPTQLPYARLSAQEKSCWWLLCTCWPAHPVLRGASNAKLKLP